MTLKIIHKNNTSAGQAPAPSDLDIGEIAVNSADAELYTKDTNGNIRKFQNTTTGTADGVQFTQAGASAVQRTVESKLQDVVSVKDFGAVGDGVTDDTSKFAIVKAAAPSEMVSLASSDYALTSLPYTFALDENDPVYYNGTFTVSGQTYQGHSLGSAISAPLQVPEQNTAHRAAIIASDRTSVGGSSGRAPSAALAASRSRIESSRGAVVAGTETDIYGAFNNFATSTRQAQIFGEQGSLVASRLSRIWGDNGVADSGNLWGKTSEYTFDPNYLDPTSGQTFRNVIASSMGVDLFTGSDNFVAASRGDVDTGNQNVNSALRVGGSRVTVLSAQGTGDGTSVEGTGILVAASQGPEVLDGAAYSSLLATKGSQLDAGAESAAIIGSDFCIASGSQQAIIATNNGRTDEPLAFQVGIIASAGTGGSPIVQSAFNRSLIVGSRNIENVTSDCLAMGRTTGALVPSGANQNQSIRLEASGGTGRFANGTTTTGLDYAELWENAVSGEIEPGHVIVREPGSRRIRVGASGDSNSLIVGVVSATPSVIGNAGDFEWHGRYKRDEWGRKIKVNVPMVSWKENDRLVEYRVEDATNLNISIPPNANYYDEIDFEPSELFNPGQKYIPRLERPDEWTVVGMVGQLLTRVKEGVSTEDFVSADGSKATEQTKIQCIEITSEYDASKGYAIAWCLVG